MFYAGSFIDTFPPRDDHTTVVSLFLLSVNLSLSRDDQRLLFNKT